MAGLSGRKESRQPCVFFNRKGNDMGYCDCSCRDCFETAIEGDDDENPLCAYCEEAECDDTGESDCQCDPDCE